MFEFFIAKRYLRSKHKINFITIISILSTLGITIGVAALVVVLSVFNGFGSLVTSVLVNFDPHVQITFKSAEGVTQADSVYNLLEHNPEVLSVSRYAEGKVVVVNKSSYEIVNLKGIENIANTDWGIKNYISFGEYDLRDTNGTGKIILGLPLALKISTRIGDTILVTSANKIEQSLITLSIPKTKRFIVSGIFEISNRDYALKYTFTSLKQAQRTFGLRSGFTGFEVRLKNMDKSDELKKFLEAHLDDKNFTIRTWYDLHKDLYDVMLIERWAAYIILSLIIAVATFNILGSLTMSVIEKRKDIGVLRAIGASNKSILKIFMFEGILIGIIGTVLGLALGLLICYLQIEYKFYSLDASKYIIDALPLQIRFSDIVVISFMSLFLTFLASMFPAKKAIGIKIGDALRWE